MDQTEQKSANPNHHFVREKGKRKKEKSGNQSGYRLTFHDRRAEEHIRTTQLATGNINGGDENKDLSSDAAGDGDVHPRLRNLGGHRDDVQTGDKRHKDLRNLAKVMLGLAEVRHQADRRAGRWSCAGDGSRTGGADTHALWSRGGSGLRGTAYFDNNGGICGGSSGAGGVRRGCVRRGRRVGGGGGGCVRDSSSSSSSSIHRCCICGGRAGSFRSIGGGIDRGGTGRKDSGSRGTIGRAALVEARLRVDFQPGERGKRQGWVLWRTRDDELRGKSEDGVGVERLPHECIST